jgi:hypothetical protein
MFQRIRKHLTPSTAIAFLALVFALTGGAFAASSNGGGGSSSHATLTASAAKAKAAPKGKAGPRGPAGAKGATGAAGPAGPAGSQGPAGAAGAAGGKGESGATGTGVEGKEGKEGAPGKEGVKGKEGSPWTAGGVLPAGKTETGTFAAQGPENDEIYVPISFAIPIEGETITKAWIGPKAQGDNPPAFCAGGSVSAPAAEPGALCIYLNGATIYELQISTVLFGNAKAEGFEELKPDGELVSPLGGPGGIIVVAVKSGIGKGPASAVVSGSFAVTAPTA